MVYHTENVLPSSENAVAPTVSPNAPAFRELALDDLATRGSHNDREHVEANDLESQYRPAIQDLVWAPDSNDYDLHLSDWLHESMPNVCTRHLTETFSRTLYTRFMH